MSGYNGGDKPPCSKETEIGILEVRVENLSSTVSEVKDLVKRIEEAVSIVRIIQVHAEQHTQEYDKLTSLVRELSQSLSEVDANLHVEISNSKAELRKDLKSLEDKNNSLEDQWKEKYNVLRGLVLGISLLAGALTGISAYLANHASSMVQESYTYMLQLKTIDALDILKRTLGENKSGGKNGDTR